MEQVSMVFQRVYLFADTVENNIKFGCPGATHKQVVEAAKKACCHDFISALPDGYNTVIGEGGATLSGGEKQRISIARCLLKDAPIVIFDEATANVDPENEDQLQKAMEALTREKTVLMIAHRLKTVRGADQILVVEDGRIVQRGTHDELMAQGGLYRRFIEIRGTGRGAGDWHEGEQQATASRILTRFRRGLSGSHPDPSYEKGTVRSVDVARHLGVSKPSVCHAVALLKDGGFLTMDEDFSLCLTDVGREVAESIYERHVFLQRS